MPVQRMRSYIWKKHNPFLVIKGTIFFFACWVEESRNRSWTYQLVREVTYKNLEEGGLSSCHHHFLSLVSCFLFEPYLLPLLDGGGLSTRTYFLGWCHTLETYPLLIFYYSFFLYIFCPKFISSFVLFSFVFSVAWIDTSH